MIRACDLDKKTLKQLHELEKICNYSLIFEEDASDIYYIIKYIDKTLVSALSFSEYEDCVEIAAITHPDFRNRGFIKKMISSIHFTKPVIYTLAADMDKTKHITYNTEYLLELTKNTHTAYEFPQEEYCMNIDTITGGHRYSLFSDSVFLGELFTYEEPTRINIYDVKIKEEYRGRGLSRILLELAYSYFPKDVPVVLQVSDSNVPAYRVYCKMGFYPISSLTYYTHS